MRDKFLKYSLGSDLFIYILRCLTGFLTGYLLYLSFPVYEFYWTMLSIVIVISPDAKDSRRLAIERFKANFIGSGSALLCYFSPLSREFVLIAGIVVTILVCYSLKLMNVARTAVVAYIIVAISEQKDHTWISSAERFGSVALGCFIGLVITLASSYPVNYLRKKANLPGEKLS